MYPIPLFNQRKNQSLNLIIIAITHKSFADIYRSSEIFHVTIFNTMILSRISRASRSSFRTVIFILFYFYLFMYHRFCFWFLNWLMATCVWCVLLRWIVFIVDCVGITICCEDFVVERIDCSVDSAWRSVHFTRGWAAESRERLFGGCWS